MILAFSLIRYLVVWEKMFRRFGQLVTLIAVLASVLNAQCALSCSILTLEETLPHHSGSALSAHSGHECCPQNSAPAPSQNHKSRACSDPMLTIAGAALSNASLAEDSLIHVDLILPAPPQPLAWVPDSAPLPPPADSPISPKRQTLFILRV